MICPNCSLEVPLSPGEAAPAACPHCTASLGGEGSEAGADAPVIRGGVRCPQCGTVNSVVNAVCRNCGQSLAGVTQAPEGAAASTAPPSLLTCPTCGAPNARDAAACRVCGALLGAPEPAAPAPSAAPAPPAPVGATLAAAASPPEFPGLGGLDVGPKDLGACLDRAFAVYKRCFGPLVLAAAVVNIPIAILNAIVMVISASMSPQFMALASGNMSAWQNFLAAAQSGSMEGILGALTGEQSVDSTTYALMLMASAAAMLVPLFAYPVLWGMAASLTAQAHFGRKPSGREAWAVTKRNYWPLVSAALLYGLAWFIGSSLCYIGLPFVLPAIVYLVPIVVFEERGAFDALSRCFKMLSRDYWRVVGWYIASWLTVVAMIWGLSWTLNGLAQTVAWVVGDPSGATPFAAAARPIAETLYVPILIVFRTLMYFDARARREALDLKVVLPVSRPEVA